MRKIRIGIDISMQWAITTDGKPVDLAGRDLTLMLTDPIGLSRKLDITVDHNIATFAFPGVEQKRLGSYTLTMWENKGKPGQNAVDKVDAFELVRTSDEMDGTDDGNLTTATVNLSTSDFSFGDAGLRQEIADVRKMVEDTQLVGATSIGGGGADDKQFV